MFKRCSAMDLGMHVMLSPIVTVYSEYSGWIATLIPSVTIGFWGESAFCVSATILHSDGIMILLRIRPGRPMISLYGDGDLTTMKFIRVLVECTPSPKDTLSDI
ncbi:hypothetical protein Tco_1124128 [Tanacetum coccineum]|uniref:Uncharacterized protein n=1 Tax=Tanacetum coccineum TaxID=301880 RepID=A0ABQ5J8A0_9ASTR